MASTTASTPMVVYWRRMKASAPSRMAFEIACISGVPVSYASTERAKKQRNKQSQHADDRARPKDMFCI